MSIKKIPASKGGKIILTYYPNGGNNPKIIEKTISSSTTIDIVWPGEAPINPVNPAVPIDEPTLYTINDNKLNDVLNNFSNIVGDINKDNNPQTYSYLHYALSSVENEWSNPSYLIQSNFEELIPWHGNDSSKEESTHEGMKDWIIAMCLAEINPVAAEVLYKTAYEKYNANNDNDLYSLNDGFTIKGDINMCRLVAAVLWAINRSRYNDATIDAMRQEIGGTIINGTWNDLSGNVIIGKINYSNIFPSAPGPYILDATAFPSLAVQGNRTPPSSQSSSLFYNNEEHMTKDYTNEFIYQPQTKNWTKYNYKIDVDIDDKVTQDYNLDNPTYYKRAAQACADAEEDIAYYFSNKVYYRRTIIYHNEISAHKVSDNVTGATNVNFLVYDKGNEVIFATAKEQSNDSSDGYLEGPFNKDVIGQDLSDCAYDGYREGKATHKRGTSQISGKTDLSHFLDIVGDLGSQSRKTLLNANYGRRRPGQGQYNHNLETEQKSPAYVENKHFRGGGNRYHPLAFMRNFSVESIIGGCATNYDINGNGVKFYYFDKSSPWDSYGSGDSPDLNDEPFLIATDLQGGAAHTYPSGHSARMFAIAISLIRLFPYKAANILKAAYSFTVSRNIVRAHWNSDIIYGRLIGAMTIPLAHANQQFLSEYSYAAAYLGISVVTPVIDADAITISLQINNESGTDVKLNGEFYIFLDVIENGKLTSNNTGKYGYEGNGLILPGGTSSTSNSIIIPNNSSKVFDITIPAATISKLSNTVSPQSRCYGHQGNIILYTYGKVPNEIDANFPEGWQTTHISDFYEHGCIDDNMQGFTLENGTLHTLKITGVKSSTAVAI